MVKNKKVVYVTAHCRVCDEYRQMEDLTVSDQGYDLILQCKTCFHYHEFTGDDVDVLEPHPDEQMFLSMIDMSELLGIPVPDHRRKLMKLDQ
jgi:hypothetical protein